MLRLAQIPEFRDKRSTSPANTSPQSYMIRAMIAGERDPQALAALARGRMKARRWTPCPVTTTASWRRCCRAISPSPMTGSAR